MKRRALIVLGALCALTLGLAFAGCSLNRLTIQDLIDRGFVHCVSFDLMGGEWGRGADSSDDEEEENGERSQYVRDNSLVIEPGSAGTLSGNRPVYAGYTFGGYWLGTQNEDKSVSFDRRWDFYTDRVTEDITLYVRWLENYSLTVHYGENYERTASVAVTQTSEGVANAINSVTIPNYTVLGVYTSQADAEAESNAVTFPYTPSYLDQEQTTGELWANTLEGTWTIVEDAEDFPQLYSSTNIWLLEDIDLGGREVSFPSSYSGTIAGNGHTIRNFTITQEMGYSATLSYGLFRTLTSTAAIRDVTFADVTFTADLSSPRPTEYRAGILAGYAQAGAVLSNVTVTGTFTFTIVEEGRNGTMYYDTLFPDGEKTIVGGNSEVDASTCSVEGVTLIKQTPEQAEANENGTDNSET